MQTETKEKLSLEELLGDECIQLPIKRKTNESYLECLDRVIHNGYLDKLKRLEPGAISDEMPEGDLVQKVQELADAIMECVRTYYSGNIGSAYNHFKETLNKVGNTTEEARKNPGLFVKASELSETTSLFRIRQSIDEDLSERKELFHIPMKQRENVVSQRFSIEGNPSLYLGSSLFICWKESNLPDIWSCYASRYEIRDSSYVLLDIRNWLPKFRKQTPVSPEDRAALYYYLSLWPLVAACSVKVSFDHKPFKPEYIIPQFLYQYTSELKFTGRTRENHDMKVLGLLYSSTRTESWEDYDPDKEYNVAIPVHQTDSENYSQELQEVLWLTRPVSWKKVLERPYDVSEKENKQPSAEHYFYHIGRSFSRMEDALTKEPVGEVGDGEF